MVLVKMRETAEQYLNKKVKSVPSFSRLFYFAFSHVMQPRCRDRTGLL
jgi:hypothetical protein